MKNRNNILEVLQKIRKRTNQLQEKVEKATDRDLENIMDGYFYEYGTNIDVNFSFMELIITRINPDADIEGSSKSKMTNDEIEKYLEEKWSLLVCT